MDVRYYSIVSAGNGWAICENGEQRSAIYGSRCEAVDHARYLAIDHWRRTGEAARVRILRSANDADWVDDIGFGVAVESRSTLG